MMTSRRLFVSSDTFVPGLTTYRFSYLNVVPSCFFVSSPTGGASAGLVVPGGGGTGTRMSLATSPGGLIPASARAISSVFTVFRSTDKPVVPDTLVNVNPGVRPAVRSRSNSSVYPIALSLSLNVAPSSVLRTRVRSTHSRSPKESSSWFFGAIGHASANARSSYTGK